MTTTVKAIPDRHLRDQNQSVAVLQKRVEISRCITLLLSARIVQIITFYAVNAPKVICFHRHVVNYGALFRSSPVYAKRELPLINGRLYVTKIAKIASITVRYGAPILRNYLVISTCGQLLLQEVRKFLVIRAVIDPNLIRTLAITIELISHMG